MVHMAETRRAQPTPVSLAPAEIESAVEEAARVKAAMPAARTFALAMFAGAFIAFGGLFFMVFTSDPSLSWGAQRLVGGVCFCLGLVLVLCCGAELFTGNSLMVCALASGKIGAGRLLRAWALVWIGNFAGSLLAVALVYLSGIYKLNGGAVANTMVGAAAGKVSLSVMEMFFRGVLCNVFVCLAMWIGFGAKTVTDKVVGILLPISGFVACGFEHSVANMFFLPMGALMRAVGYGAGAAGSGALSLSGIALNLAVVTLGNIVGGALLVGLGYRFAYGRRGE